MMHARRGARAITRRCELNRTGSPMGMSEASGRDPARRRALASRG
jgi:hypothetical protein